MMLVFTEIAVRGLADFVADALEPLGHRVVGSRFVPERTLAAIVGSTRPRRPRSVTGVVGDRPITRLVLALKLAND